MEDLIRIGEIAAEMHVTRQTVTRWIRDGLLPARRVKVGDQVRYQVRRVDYRAFVRRYVSGDW